MDLKRTTQANVEIEQNLWIAVGEYCVKSGVKKKDFVDDALRKYLEQQKALKKI